MVEEQIRALFLANAAVLLTYRGTKLLIDGIYDKRGHSFSNLSAGQWEGLKRGEGEFSGIDYLLFTHEHGDHFSPAAVMEYLDAQRPKAIFMPRRGSGELEALQKKADAMGIPCALLEEDFCRKTVFKPEEGIQIKAFQTRHLDRIYWNVPHFCLLLELGEKRLLFTADVDFGHESFAALEGSMLDAVFLNPLMRQSKEGRRLFSDGFLRTKREVVYHIPFAEDDCMEMWKMVEREQRVEKENGGNAVFLTERGQTFFL